MNALIICSGTFSDYSFYEKYVCNAGFILCADGGARHARRLKVVPDVLLGDFDSISPEDYEYCKLLDARIMKYPASKDRTDSEIAVDIALDRGCERIVILGGLGTRADHSIANIGLLKKIAHRGAFGTLVNEHNEIFYVTRRLVLHREDGYKVSLVPASSVVKGIKTSGLMYELSEAVIEYGSTLGVSNEFVKDKARISIKSGALLVIKSRD